MGFPRRISLAVGLRRDGELITLGISEKPSELLPLLDQVDPGEIQTAGILKDVQFHPGTRRSYELPPAESE